MALSPRCAVPFRQTVVTVENCGCTWMISTVPSKVSLRPRLMPVSGSRNIVLAIVAFVVTLAVIYALFRYIQAAIERA